MDPTASFDPRFSDPAARPASWDEVRRVLDAAELFGDDGPGGRASARHAARRRDGRRDRGTSATGLDEQKARNLGHNAHVRAHDRRERLVRGHGPRRRRDRRASDGPGGDARDRRRLRRPSTTATGTSRSVTPSSATATAAKRASSASSPRRSWRSPRTLTGRRRSGSRRACRRRAGTPSRSGRPRGCRGSTRRRTRRAPRRTRLGPAVLLGVRAGRDRRPVARLEVLAVVARALEDGDLEVVALAACRSSTRPPNSSRQVLLAAPQGRGRGARRGRRGERPDRPEERAEHAVRRPAQQAHPAARAGTPAPGRPPAGGAART